MIQWAIRRSLRSCLQTCPSSQTHSPVQQAEWWAAGWTHPWGGPSPIWTSSSWKALGRGSRRMSSNQRRGGAGLSEMQWSVATMQYNPPPHPNTDWHTTGNQLTLASSIKLGADLLYKSPFSWTNRLLGHRLPPEHQGPAEPQEPAGDSCMQSLLHSAAHLCGQGPSPQPTYPPSTPCHIYSLSRRVSASGFPYSTHEAKGVEAKGAVQGPAASVLSPLGQNKEGWMGHAAFRPRHEEVTPNLHNSTGEASEASSRWTAMAAQAIGWAVPEAQKD